MSLLGHKVVHTELFVPAAPEAVWSVVTDPTGYPEWNPILVRAEGRYEEGASMTYKMRDPAGKDSDVTSTVVRVVENELLNQFGGIRGVLTFDHTWRLEPVEGGTRVVQHEEYRGVGVWFWDPGWVEDAYRRANDGLRDRVRALGASPTGAAE